MDTNISSQVLESLSCGKIYHHEVLQIPRTILTALVALLIIFGNSLCLICLRRITVFSGTTKVFMTSLTVADLMMGVLICTPSTISASVSMWLLGRETCLITAHLNFYLVTMSVLSLLMVSVDRYLAVTKPLRYEVLLTPRRATLAVVLVWLLALAFGLVVLFAFGSQVCYDPMLNICIPITGPSGSINLGTITYFVVVIMSSYLSTLAIYCRLYLIARHHSHRIHEANDHLNGARPVRHPRSKATKTFAIVAIAFGVSYIPMIAIAVDFFITFKGCPYAICGLASVCTLSNSWWNVAIYCIRTTSFRQAVKHLFRRKNPDLHINSSTRRPQVSSTQCHVQDVL